MIVALVAFATFLLLATLSCIWRGYVLTVLWSWFMTPTFGLPALAVAPAIGLALVVSSLTYQFDAANDQDGDFTSRISKAVGQVLLVPAMALGFGWIVRLFM